MNYSHLLNNQKTASLSKTIKTGLAFLITAFLIMMPDLKAENLNTVKSNLAIPIACNDLVQISLDENCYALLTPEDILQDMQGVAADYTIEVYLNSVKQSDLIFGAQDINKVFTYTIWHNASRNSCWGAIKIEDKLAPLLECNPDNIRCVDQYGADVLGFPIPSSFIGIHIDTIGWDTTGGRNIPIKFRVYNWDACSSVYLSYQDQIDYYGCDSLCFRKIFREWVAVDSAGNVSRCTEVICMLRPDASDIVRPRHYDGFDLPYLRCNDVYPKLPNGHPSPAHTGFPVAELCNTLVATYTDLKIDVCDNSFKLLRRWSIVDWCTREIYEYTQLIKVIDDEGPLFDVPQDYIVGMAPWTCGSYGKILPPTNVRDCGRWTYDIYTRIEDPVTGDTGAKSKDFITYNITEKCFYLIGAPEGRIWIEYQLTDHCGNISDSTIEVGVVDDQIPVAICDQLTVVTLTSDGTAKAYAETFDDGSFDNCAIDEFRVRRMVDSCYNGTHEFGPYVEFCCRDIGQIVMVAMEVTDTYGNKNTCMVEVIVQEKEPPIVIAPSDITITCEFDRTHLEDFGVIRYSQADRQNIIIRDHYYSNNNWIAGLDGFAYDNCEVTVTEEVTDSLLCNQGKIWRKFIARDKQGLMSMDIQVITIVNIDPFYIDPYDHLSTTDDVVWPEETVKIFSCRTADTHPNNTGTPVFLNTGCAQISINYSDSRLNVLDSVCYKIIRTWTILDWCQYEARTQKGIWEFKQVILVQNNIPPDIYTCQDVDICDDSAYFDINTDLCMAHYDLVADGEDDCTYPEHIIWSYRIDENNDGTFGLPIIGKRATGVLPVGTHRIRWIAADQCGNINQCDHLITLTDCKKPTPYCLSGVNTVIMPTTGTIAIWAKDFDLGSTDNCTPKANLKISFSSDTSHTSITYHCDSLAGQSFITRIVRIYITDEAGNQDYCETQVRIQDNNNSCGNTLISGGGQLSRANNTPIPEAVIEVYNQTNDLIHSIESDALGKYAFLPLLLHQVSYFKVSKIDEASLGITTQDIIKIQKHILGQKFIDSPYEILAADVNRSNSITARDISEIRKLILGISEEYTSNRVWMFVPGSQNFPNALTPWNFKESILASEVNGQLSELNFVGIKLGDVDHSAKLSLSGQISGRSLFTKNLIAEKIPGTSKIVISADEDLNLDGLQLSFDLDETQELIVYSEKLNIRPEHFKQHQTAHNSSNLRISWAANQTMKISKGEVLFYVEGTTANIGEHMELSSQTIDNEIYLEGDEVASVALSIKGSIPNASMFELAQNIPNPFTDFTTIEIQSQMSFTGILSIVDATGKEVLRRNVSISKGRNMIELNRSDLPVDGIYLYKLEGPTAVRVKKMWIVK